MNTQPKRIAMVFVEGELLRSSRLATGVLKSLSSRTDLLIKNFIQKPTRKCPRDLLSWGAQGVITSFNLDEYAWTKRLILSGIPIVSTVYCPLHPLCGLVKADDQEINRVALDHFSDMGLRHVATLHMGKTADVQAVHRCFLDMTLERMTLHPYRMNTVPDDVWMRRYPKQLAPALVKWLEELPKPIGLLTRQLLIGPYICRAAELLGLKVPEDIAIIGMDEEDVCLACSPSMTSIRIPLRHIGSATAHLMEQMIDGKPAPPEPVIVPGAELIIRDSTLGLEPIGWNLDAALDYIDDHACEGITVSDIVRTQGVSRLTFEQRFKQATGNTPGAVIRNRQFDMAKHLLIHTAFSISTISEMCGFCNSNYFAYRFRSTQGMPPRAYRRQNNPH